MKRSTAIYLTVVILLGLIERAHASEFYLNGKQVTKGEALIALARDSKVKVTKVDTMEISDKGTLKAVKTSK